MKKEYIMKNGNIEEKYKRRINRYDRLFQKQKKAEWEISILRLLVFLTGISVSILTYRTNKNILFSASLIIFSSAFIYLVIYHKNLKVRMKYTSLLKEINIISLKRLNGEWNTFKDDGGDFIDDNHNYKSDLDIFGQNSLFQWINSCNTYIGRLKLAELLSTTIGTTNEILSRQEAVSELASMLKFRQRLTAEGMVISDKMRNPEDLYDWASERNEFYMKPWLIGLFRIIPVITIILIIISFVLNKLPWYVPVTALIIQYSLIAYKVKNRYDMFTIAENYNDDLRVYYKMLRLIEEHNFKSSYLNELKDVLKDSDGIEAYKQIDKLSSIIDSIANRRNGYYIIFNVLTLCDFQMAIALEGWKIKSGNLLKDWLEAVGKFEAISSLSIVGFDHEDWKFPIICDSEKPVFEAENMGHPLITKDRVDNDLRFDNKTKVILITGSNMSGKSTLLRTSGINLVLAYAGAPVCAEYLKASLMEIHTCMRIADNLGENISSFYAELLRIKNIVAEAKKGKKIFFLLDEIFRGTNSIDRHTGARVLINELSKTNSIGLVSTHDLELCDLEDENKKIKNYHFQEYYKDNKIYFDYKLRPGASTTRNALYLIRLAGIDLP